jgi:tRNA dimethylallyltransferase
MIDPLVVIVGPTAVGKTALSLRLAQAIHAEIVSIDSRQMYRYLDIGTAKPIPSQRAEVPHHLLDVLSPDQPTTAAQCGDLARQALDDIWRRGQRAVIVAGSGLHLQALLYGLMPAPPANGRLRAELRSYAERHGNAALHALLQRADPAYAAACHVQDRVRVVRALEVTYLTGVPFSEHCFRHQARKPLLPYVGIALTRDRAELYARIGERTDAMLAAGWLAEVEMLVARGYTETCAAMNGLGYRELMGYLAGRSGWQETVDAIKQATRRFAKRQLTWFAKLPGLSWYNLTCVDESTAVAEIVNTLRLGMELQAGTRSP